MPTLKQLTCHIEWGNSGVPFKEHGTSYGDGVVESYVAIPNHPAPFSISLKSHGYISSGLAMFVFADGVYQCNRNRDNLKYPENPVEPDEKDKKNCEVNFRVRQREENRGGETWVGRQWRFEPLNLVEPNPMQPKPESTSHFKYLGTIQVIVLRCTACPGNLADTWGEYAPSRSLSPESSTAPVLDFEDSAATDEEQRNNVKQADALWAVYDGSGDSWPNHNRRNNQRNTNGNRYERKSNKREHWSVNRDGEWGESQASRHSPNPSVVVNIHTRGSRDSSSEWHNRPISPQTQIKSGCYNIQNGRRVHGSSDWRQERSPSVESQALEDDHNRSNGDDNDWTHNEDEQPSAWNSQTQENGWGDDKWENVHENNRSNDNNWADSQNDNNGNNETWPKGDAGDWEHDQNNQNNTDEWDWTNTNNDQNNWDKNNTNDPWANDNSGRNDGDSNQPDTDDWVHVNNHENDNDRNSYNGNAGSGNWENDNNDQENTGQWPAENDGQWSNNNNFDWENGNVEAEGNDDWNNDNINQQPANNWVEEDNNRSASAGRQNSPVPPMHPEPQQYRPPSSHGELPNRSAEKKHTFVTPRLVQAVRNDEPLLYTVPTDVAKEKLTTHQVQPGASVAYTHKLGTPDYLDTIEKPYAMFCFKYRQKEVIEQMLGISIDRDVEFEKRKLESLPREVIVDQLLRAQGILGDHIPFPNNSSQDEKQKWRVELPLSENYTTTPAVPESTPQSFNATSAPAPDTTGVANESDWPDVGQPTPSTFEPNATVNTTHEGNTTQEGWYGNVSPPVVPAGSPVLGSPVLGSPTTRDWTDISNQPPADLFSSSLNAKLQSVADKHSTSSKDSWATRTSADARNRDLSRCMTGALPGTSRPGSGGGSQSNVQGSRANAPADSQKSESVRSKKSQPNTSQVGGIVAGPWQTYRPSNPDSRRSGRNEDGSNKSGSKGGQGASGSAGAAAPAEEVSW